METPIIINLDGFSVEQMELIIKMKQFVPEKSHVMLLYGLADAMKKEKYYCKGSIEEGYKPPVDMPFQVFSVPGHNDIYYNKAHKIYYLTNFNLFL